MTEEKFEEELMEVIANASGKDYLTDVGELSLDNLLGEGIVKEIPLVKTLAALYRAGIGVKGYLFVRKLKKFLVALSDVSIEERQAFVSRLGDDGNFRRRVGDKLLLILDKLDDMPKAELIALAFKAFIRDTIDFDTFQRLSTAVDRCIVSDLAILRTVGQRAELESHIAQVLMSTGLLDIDATPSVRGPGPESRNIYRLTDLGRTFVDVVMIGD